MASSFGVRTSYLPLETRRSLALLVATGNKPLHLRQCHGRTRRARTLMVPGVQRPSG